MEDKMKMADAHPHVQLALVHLSKTIGDLLELHSMPTLSEVDYWTERLVELQLVRDVPQIHSHRPTVVAMVMGLLGDVLECQVLALVDLYWCLQLVLLVALVLRMQYLRTILSWKGKAYSRFAH